MFCPQCATENGWELAYCRQCGQPLADVRMALERKPTESLEHLKAGEHWMNGGIATVIAFMLIAGILSVISINTGHPVLIAIAMLIALIGAVVGVPLVLIGRANMKRATRLLGSTSEKNVPAPFLTSDHDSQYRQLKPPGSVTENTTLDLKAASARIVDKAD